MPVSNDKNKPPNSRSNTTTLLSWSLYDWANSGSTTIIQTFIFPTYFVAHVASSKDIGVTLWGLMVGIAGLIIALGGPILGAIADYSGRRKLWLTLFTAMCILCTAALWLITPTPDRMMEGLFLVGLAILGYEFSYIFYNAMLPAIALDKEIGRWSGWGWGFGYLGGIASLVLCLLLFIQSDPWIALDRTSYEHIRATFLFAAVWSFVFTIPLLLFVPSDKTNKLPLGAAIRMGLKQIRNTLSQVKSFSGNFRFLIARMIYTDGLLTLFAFGGVYAAAAFGMNEIQILWFAISLNVTAGIGAFLLGFYDDKVGSKNMILLSLVCMTILTTLALLARNEAEFWICGLLVGIFVGPVQASSRSYLARMVPPEKMNQMFGFFALTGRATSFLGPLLVSLLTYLTGSLHIGLSIIVVFFVIGGLFALKIPSDRR